MKLSAILRAWLRKMPGSWIYKPLEGIRIRAVERVQAPGREPRVVAALGFSRACIYRAGSVSGWSCGPLAGRPPKITGAQLLLASTVVGKNPLQFQFEFALLRAG